MKETASLNLKSGPPLMPTKALAVELELHRHHHACLARRRLGVAADMHDARVPEDGDVELRGLLGLGVEPEVRDDLLRHDAASSRRGRVMRPSPAPKLIGAGVRRVLTGRPPRT